MGNLAKTTLAAALSWSGINAWLRQRPPAMPLILGYHRVVESAAAMGEQTFSGMTVSQPTLRAHLEWVGRRFRFVSLDELGALLERRAPCGNLAAVTFDDGYQDVHDYGLPLLQQMGVPAGVFVVSGLIGTKNLLLHDQLYQVVSEAFATNRAMPASFVNALKGCNHWNRRASTARTHAVRALLERVPVANLRRIVDELNAERSWRPPSNDLAPVDWEALKAMQRAGVIIGSHTHTHAVLTREDDATVLEELKRSRSVLEAGLGARVRHFAYPDGRFDPRVLRAVTAAGYRYAYTICNHRDPWNPLLTIPRLMLWEASCNGMFGGFSASLMDCHVASLLPFPATCRDNHGVYGPGGTHDQ
jgi:peptidoglycan/xylan/chitin deacetylase (PgdA/CDA1 family)